MCFPELHARDSRTTKPGMPAPIPARPSPVFGVSTTLHASASNRHMRRHLLALLVAVPAAVLSLATVAGPQNATTEELKQAEADVPKLADVLGLEPGMTVADVGAGGGAMTLVMARWLGPAGRIYSTDINPASVRAIHDQAVRAHLANVITRIGTQSGTNLPNACCDAIWLRDVYHHLTDPGAEDRSLLESLKSGGRLAIIDFEPQPGSKPPPGVPADRTGHGITPTIVAHELTAAGFMVDKTITHWPVPDQSASFLVLARKPESNLSGRVARVH